jgi:Host cell surface-exposed lipoprotein
VPEQWERRDYRYGQDQSGPQGQDPRSRPAVTPPQWGSAAPPRQDGTRSAQQYPSEPQAVFRPAPYPAQPQPPRGQFPPPQSAGLQQPQPAPGAPPHRKRHSGRKAFGALAGAGAAIIVIAVAANGGHGTATTLSAGPGTQSQTAAAPVQSASQVPGQAAVGVPANSGPAGTASELQALAAAEDYLSDGQGFSRQGLIGQLDSSFGDNFSVGDATWGVDHSDANWDDQAVDCAKGYMSDGQGFSRQGLIQQMTSSYGNQFTEAQAEYAANAVGL